MAWVKFTADFEYRQPSHSVDYKSGWVGSVRAQIAEAAVAAGKAVRVPTPRKGGAPDTSSGVTEASDEATT